jgi:hypothetical protein
MYWFRARAQQIAGALLVSVVALGGSMAAPHVDDCHDAACAPVPVSHDADAHAFRGAPDGGGAHPLHCLVCHWARSFRPNTEVRFVTLPSVQAGIRVHVESFTAAHVTTVAQPPLRSPPPTSPLA